MESSNCMNIFRSEQFGQVRTILNYDGSISINAEDVARGLGWYQIKNNKLYIKWERINGYVCELGFSPKLEKDDYIPESVYYMLCMKANSRIAQEFQRWIAVEVLPEIRKNGLYKSHSYESDISDSELSPELKAIFCIDKRTVEITKRIEKLENTMTIDFSEQEVLRNLAARKVVAALGGKHTPAYRELNSKAFSSIWGHFKRVMNINSYKDTSKKMYETARKVINEWQPDRDLELMIIGANSVIE